MAHERFFRTLFQVGALWNVAVAAQLLLFQKFIFAFLGMPPLTYPVFYQMFCGAVLLFGVGYYLVSRDLSRNHDLVKLGVAGKILVCAFMFTYAGSGSLPWLFVGPGLVDLLFAGLFIHFLIAFRSSTEKYCHANV